MKKTEKSLLDSKGIRSSSNLSEEFFWNNTKLLPQEMVEQRQFCNQEV